MHARARVCVLGVGCMCVFVHVHVCAFLIFVDLLMCLYVLPAYMYVYHVMPYVQDMCAYTNKNSRPTQYLYCGI